MIQHNSFFYFIQHYVSKQEIIETTMTEYGKKHTNKYKYNKVFAQYKSKNNITSMNLMYSYVDFHLDIYLRLKNLYIIKHML